MCTSTFLFVEFILDKKNKTDFVGDLMKNDFLLNTMEFLQLKIRRKLQSCFYSFVPFALSIPFLFLYALQRLSVWLCLISIGILFLAHFFTFRRFYDDEVFIRAHWLTFLLTIGFIWSFSTAAIGLFTVTLAIFHLSEFITVGLCCPRTLSLNSFLINHSTSYHAAIAIAYIEYFIEKFYFWPNGFPFQWIFTLVGLITILTGEYLRKLAMYTARQSFSHLIEDKPNQDHRLITHGIYARYRHPSYVGWFLWACGTQILLANPIGFLIYLGVRRFNFLFQIFTSTLFFFSHRGFSFLIESNMKKKHC